MLVLTTMLNRKTLKQRLIIYIMLYCIGIPNFLKLANTSCGIAIVRYSFF